ncbi:SDR family oxidoreductase [soil metagenome]
MKVAVFGASGRTGKFVCKNAVQKGYEVVAIVRDPAKVESLARVQALKVDIFNVEEVKASLKGVDAVFNCLGSNDLAKTNLQRTTIKIILDAMRACDIKRIIVLGASGALHDPMKHEGLGRRIFFWIIRNTFLKNPMDDSGAQQKIVEDSEMDFTIVHPPRLTDGRSTGKYRVDQEGLPKGGRELGREDLSAYMVSLIDDASSIRKGTYIAY